MKLDQLHQIIADRLTGIANALPDTYKLTLVARYTGGQYDDADIVVTDDEMLCAVRALIRRSEADKPEQPSPDVAVDPREGWRLLRDEEVIQIGDEYRINGLWFPVGRNRASLDLFPVEGIAYRRRITAQEGR